MKKAFQDMQYELGEVNPIHTDYNGSSTSKRQRGFKLGYKNIILKILSDISLNNDSLREEFADEFALIDSFSPGNDDINFDFEFDLRELECLLNRYPSIDSSTKNNIKMIDSILEGFTDEVSLVDSFPPRNDDDLFDFEADTEE
ncbi:hypothetical protein Tco_1206487 [Tanacetum coccineum]